MAHDDDSTNPTKLQIVGRSSSHFTRLPRIFAEELGLDLPLVPLHDMASQNPADYGGHPALKIPALKRGSSVVFGAENICRTLAEVAGGELRIVWPEMLHDDLARSAQELLWHSMAAQVQLVGGLLLAKLPADNIYFVKARAGFEGALRWLDGHLDRVLERLPPRDLSLFEVALFCLIDHMIFRETLPVEPYPALLRFASEFGRRPSAQKTTYRFDRPL